MQDICGCMQGGPSSYRYIAVEGNIGAGKTTLATRLAAYFQARPVLESFAENTFLPLFYADQERYAFPLELSFLADRYKQLSEELSPPDLFRQTVVSDYLFIKSKLFARTTLGPDEYQLFLKLFDIINLQLPQPDLLIYLSAPVPVLQQRIRTRGRTYEQDIPDDYLTRVAATYESWLKTTTCRVLFVDTVRHNFLDEGAFSTLTDFLENPPAFRRYYFE